MSGIGREVRFSSPRSLAPLCAIALALLLNAPAGAEAPYGPGDLAGLWTLHLLSGSGTNTSPGSTLRSVIEIDGAGTITTGTVHHADGGTTVITGGNLSVDPEGLVTGTFAAGAATATVVEARVLRDRQTVVGVISGGDLGDVEGVDFGLFTLVREVSGADTTELSGTWRHHELRTPGVVGAPSAWVVGSIAFDPPGSVAGGELADSAGHTGPPAGSLAASNAGEVTGTLTAITAGTSLHGQLTASGDRLMATTSANGSAFGMALLSRVPATGGFAPADARGPWRVYSLALDGSTGNRGTFLRGSLTFDPAGAVFRARLLDAAGKEIALAGPLTVDPATGRITGTLTGAGGATLALDATLRGPRDSATGVLTLQVGAGTQRGLLALVRTVAGLRLSSTTYTGTEGGTAEVVVRRTGDTTRALSAQLVFRLANGSIERTLPVALGAESLSRSVPVPIAEATLGPAAARTVELLTTESDVVLEAPSQATLVIMDSEPVSTIAFATGEYRVKEGNQSVTVVVKRTATKLVGGVTVQVAADSGASTAIAGVDYVPLGDTPLTFGTGVSSLSFVVKTKDDRVAQGPRQLILTLGNASAGAVLGSQATTKVTITDDDVAGSIQFSKAAYEGFESTAPPGVPITVTRTGGKASGITVEYELVDDTARAGVDYVAPTSSVLTFAADVDSVTFFVAVNNTPPAEGDRALTLRLKNAGGGATLGTRREARLTILDDEVGVRFSAPAYTVNEDGKEAAITVLRTGPTTARASVAYATADGTAIAGTDYTAASGRLIFEKGEKSKTFKVKLADDAVVEEPETVLLMLSSPEGAILGSVAQAVLTIADSDKAGTIRLAAANVSVRESPPPGLAQAVAVVVVTREGGSGIVTVDYATSDGTGQAGRHYSQTSGQLTFGGGEKSRTILVPVLDNRVADGNHTFRVTLANVSAGGTLGTPSEGLVTIVDDDVAGVIQFKEVAYRVTEPSTAATTTIAITVERLGDKNALAGGVSVQYATHDGSAVADAAGALGDYVPTAGQLVFGPGEQLKAFEVTVRGDTVLEPDETVMLTLSDPQGGTTLGARATAVLTIVDASPSVQFSQVEYGAVEAAKSVTVTVVRSGPVDDRLLVSYATADIPAGEAPAGSGAVAGVNYKATSGTLTFLPKQPTATFAVTILDDGLKASPPRSFRVVLPGARKSATGETVPLGAVSTALVTIRDNPVPVVQFASAEYGVREGDSVTVTVLRSENLTGTSVVDWTAPAGSVVDFTPASGRLTFAPGVASRTLTLRATADRLVEGPETFVLALVPGPPAVAGTQATTTLTIQDVDVGGVFDFSGDTFTVAEGGTATITVVRSGGQGGGVTVNYATVDGSAIANTDYEPVTTGALSFRAGVTTMTFQVKTKSNATPGPDKAFGVVLSQPAPPGLVALGARTSATVTIVDAQPRIAFSAAAYRVEEGKKAKITLTRTPPLKGDVTVRFVTSTSPGPGRAVAGVDYDHVDTVLTLRAGAPSQDFEVVPTINNTRVDGARTLTLTLSLPTGASLGLATAELTIDDDERPGTLGFTQRGYMVTEGGTATLEVARIGGTSGAVSVRYEIAAEGTATGGGVDYTLAPGTLTFADGESRAVITVPTVADGLPEGTETVIVRLADPTNGATLGAIAATTLFIVDAQQTIAFNTAEYSVDEKAATASITVARSGVPTDRVTVQFRTVGGTADPDRDYEPVDTPLEFAPGEVTKTVPIKIRKTAAAGKGNRTVGLALAGPPDRLGKQSTATLTILDFLPDVIVLTVRPSNSAIAGKALAAPIQIQNLGLVNAPPFQVGVFMAKKDTPGADQPGAGRLLAVQSLNGLTAGTSTGLDLSVGIADDVAPGEYYMSAVADFGQAIPESNESNNGRGSAPTIFRVSRDAGKYTLASADIAQGDSVVILGGRPFGTQVEGGCDATGNVSLSGSFQIVSQIGQQAEAAATLTGTFNDQPVRYALGLSLDLGDDDSVRGSFTIQSITGAFSGTGVGTLAGGLVASILQGNISGTITTSTPRACQFAGTLTASGDPSVALAIQQRAVGGHFQGGPTPAVEPARVSEYLATFRAMFDSRFPPPAAVTFTGPGGSRLADTPASARRSDLDEAAAVAEYVSPLVPLVTGAPGGLWSVSYKGTPRLFTLPEPGTDKRLLLPVPTASVDTGGVLKALSWTWLDRFGNPAAVQPYVDRVAVRLEPSAGLAPLYESARMLRGNTSHTLTSRVLWEDVAEVAMLYVDSVTGNEYRVAYPRAVRAGVDLGFERSTDKTGTHEAQLLTVTFQAPTRYVSSSTPGVVTVSGGPFAGEIVPFVGQTLVDDVPTNVFRLRRDVTHTPPAPGTSLVVGVTPITGPARSLVTSVRNAATTEVIDVTSPAGTAEADATLGSARTVTWTLPRPAAAGGFDVAAVTLTGIARADDGSEFCAATADSELAPDATSGVLTFPATCFKRPVESAQVCVAILGTGGERTDACHGFGPDDDVVQFDSRDYSVTEGGEATITVTRQGPKRHASTVGFATTATGTAVAGDAYEATSGSLTFGPGVGTAAFTVKTKGDRLAEPGSTVVLQLANTSAGTILGKSSQATLTIKDDDDGGDIRFAVDRLSLREGTTDKLVVVRKGTNLAGNVSVDYAVVGGTATAADYTLKGQLTFGPDDTQQTIEIATAGDQVAQGDRTLVVRLLNPRGGGRLVKPFEATVTITDDEQGGRIQFQQSERKVGERDGIVLLSVNRSAMSPLNLFGLAANVSVSYRVIGGSAKAGVDYTLPSGPLVFGASVTGLTIPLHVLDNAIGDGDRTLTLELFDVRGGASPGTPTRLTVTIQDDEQTFEFQNATYSVTENKSVTLVVKRTASTSVLATQATVQFATVTATAGASDFESRNGTLTFKPGITEQSITIKTRDDQAAEGDETFFVDLSAPSPAGAVLGAKSRATVTILDDEQLVQLAGNVAVTEGTPATLTVTRKGGLATETNVFLAIQPGGTAVAGVDYEPPTSLKVKFPPSNASQAFTVRTLGNMLFDGNRSFVVRLLSANTSTGAGVGLGTPSQATVTILDDDAGGSLAFEPAAVTVSEKTTSGIALTVRRTAPADRSLGGPVFVDYTVAPASTAQAGVDYQPLPSGTLTFTGNQSTATILVRPIDNSAAVGNRTVLVDLVNQRGGGASLGAAGRGTVVIEDDDQVVQFSKSAYSVTEGAVATITVVRSGATKQKATVQYTAGVDGSPDYFKASGTLTFAPGETERTFAVTTKQDSIAEGTESLTLLLANASPGVVLGPRSQATLSIVDDDEGGTIQFAASAFSVSEGQTASLKVTRTGTGLKLAGNVGVDYQIVPGAGTAVPNLDYEPPTSSRLTFDKDQTSLTIPVVTRKDSVVDGPRTLVVRLSGPGGGGRLGTPSDTTLTITDIDQGGVIQFSQPLVTIDESAGTASLTVSRTGTNLAGGVSVDVRVATGGTAPSTDYSLLTPTLTFGANASTATVKVKVNDNAVADGSRTVLLDLVNPRGGATLGAVTRATLTILDDAQVVQFTASTYLVAEGGKIKLELTRSGSTAAKADVKFQTVSNTAKAGVDFQAQNGSATFQAGSSTATITIATIPNNIFTATPLSFFVDLVLVPGSGMQLGSRSRATITIQDDEQKVQFDQSSYSVKEGDTVTLKVVRLGTPTGTRTVQWETHTGTAGTKDFVDDIGRLIFADGVTSLTITVKTRTDSVSEGAETFTVVLSDPDAPLQLGTPSTAQVTILPN